jgi:hypothetical protein
MRKHIRILFCNVLILTLAAGCSSKRGATIEFLRFEKVVFDTPQQQMATRLAEFKKAYPCPMLNIYPDNAEYMHNLMDFASDNIMRSIYQSVMTHYADLRWLEKEVGNAMAKAHKLMDDIDIEHYATFVSGLLDYSQRIVVDRDSRSLLVSIDQYVLPYMEKHSYFDLPMYIVERCDSSLIASDIMAEVARQYIASPDEDNTTMLDLMVAEGKVLYFLDKTMPGKEDRLKIRYSEEQMEWARKNESNIWKYFIQNNLLYEKDYNRYHNFVDEAPKTNAFKDSAPRTTDYIGWQIVRRYMENSGSSLADLFANNDSQQILQQSKYKP